MPELPEVETIRRGLQPKICGSQIIDVWSSNKALRFPVPACHLKKLIGGQFNSVKRIGKYLLFELSDDRMFLSHLGMSGSWKISQKTLKTTVTTMPEKHVHLNLSLQNQEGSCFSLIYRDVRRFGFVDVFPMSELKSHKRLKNLGVDPLGKDFTEKFLKNRFKKISKELKLALLDQSLIAGLGNIYVCEALHRSQLSPFQKTKELSYETDEAMYYRKKLISAIRSVLKDALKAGGSSLKDYIHADGSLGYFQNRFLVYSKAGELCMTCGNEILSVKQSGRSTFYCGSCQLV